MREEIIGNCRLILGDCRDLLPQMRDGEVGTVITDPPYGIGKDGQKRTTGGHGGRKAHDFKGWDQTRPVASVFDAMRRVSQRQVIWGGNYFADLLPPTGKWLVWDKGQRINQSDGELAWTSEPGAMRIFTQNRVALLVEGAEHPTQKPLEIMRWSILEVHKGGTILDCFCGSGSTGVAAIELGHSFIGIEHDQDYFDIACRRIEAAEREPDIFLSPAIVPVQQELL